MSQIRGLLDENPELESTLDRVREWYHVPALVLVFGFMLWNRVRNYSNFIVDGQVLFSGQDAWYHYRSTMYVVRNWPMTMPFDPWTRFPTGTRSGQFGTLMDQVFGTIALIVGLGSPTEQTVGMVALVAPPLMGALAAIPTYYIGRRLGGRIGGVSAIVVLALSSGLFLRRSLVGVYDHQVAEALLQVTAIMAVMVALSVAERDKPIYEQFLERDVESLRETVGYSVMAGFAIALYLWTWPPAVLLLGILGTFFLLWLTLEFVRGNSPEHTAIAGAVMMGSVTVFQLASLRTLEVNAVDYTLLQPGLALFIGGGCVFMAWLARYVESSDYDRTVYPVAIGGIIATITVLMAVFTPNLLSYFIDQLLRVVGFTASPSARVATVGEATPLRNPIRLYEAYGLSLFIAVIGAGLILFRQFRREATAETFLMVVWGAFILAASFTQIRFGIYLVFPVAVLTGMMIRYVVDLTDFSFDGDIEPYEVLTISAVALAVLGTLLLGPTAMFYGATASPGGSAAGWTDGLDWLEENSPEEGQFGEGNTTLEYYGTYQVTDDYDYPEGSYGVLSWWDYGHLITVQGERIPVANPFQQGATTAANFLLAPDEAEANRVLDSAEASEDDAETRYVAVDWQMANTYGQISRGKFFAPSSFTDTQDVTRTDYYRPIFALQPSRNVQALTPNSAARFNLRSQRYYQSTMIRLYHYHGSAAEPEPVVVDWEINQIQGRDFRTTPENGPAVRTFNSTAAARAYAEEDGTAQVGGFGTLPSERVPAMENYRYVGSSEQNAYESSRHNRGVATEAGVLGFYQPRLSENCGNGTSLPVGNANLCMSNNVADIMNQNNPAWTKVFERVPGATIEGTGPANTTIEASVEMVNHETGETFTYTQQTRTGPDGNFEMTVPYSTTGYDEYGPENGYTNVSVRANGPYEFAVPLGNAAIPLQGSAQVTEGQVIGQNETASTVDLQVAQQRQPTDETDAMGDDGN